MQYHNYFRRAVRPSASNMLEMVNMLYSIRNALGYSVNDIYKILAKSDVIKNKWNAVFIYFYYKIFSGPFFTTLYFFKLQLEGKPSLIRAVYWISNCTMFDKFIQTVKILIDSSSCRIVGLYCKSQYKSADRMADH